jgi:endoglycosylceramidase
VTVAGALLVALLLIVAACSSSDSGSEPEGDGGSDETAADGSTTTADGAAPTGEDGLSEPLDVDTGCTGYDPAAGELVADDSTAVSDLLPPADAELVESPDGRFMTDRWGRVVISHGINVVSAAKGAPDRVADIDEQVVADLADRWGFNVSRHLIFWDAIEPAEGQFNDRYLDLVEQRLDWYAEHGLYVILDMHQDIWSACFTGDGAPAWASITDGEEFTHDPDQPWFMQNLDPAVQNAGMNFFMPERGHAEGLQSHYVQSWQRVVERFHDHPAVLGYDIMNEPTFNSLGTVEEAAATAEELQGTDDWHNPNLEAFTQRVIDGIREHDGSGWIVVEPTSVVNALEYPGDLLEISDPRDGPSRLVYGPHLYDSTLDGGADFDPATNTYVDTWADLRTADAERLGGIPLWIGEYGQGELGGIDAYFDQILTMADQQMIGWSLWSYDPGDWSVVDGDGNDNPRADWIVRPYPRAVNGIPTSFGFDPETNVFSFEWDPNPDAEGPTLVYVPAERHYPDGWVMVLDGEVVEPVDAWDADRELLSIEPDDAAHQLCIARAATDC